MPIILGAASSAALQPSAPSYGINAGPPARAIARYGGLALPGSTSVQAWIDLNDTTFWRLQDYGIGDPNRQIGAAQRAWRARGSYTSDDFGKGGIGREITLPEEYMEDATHALSGAMGPIQQAGEQYLTFDGATYFLAKYKGNTVPKLKTPKTNPAWWSLALQFVCRDSWAYDFQLSGSLSNLLNPIGGFEPGSATPTGWSQVTDSGAPAYTWDATVSQSGTHSGKIVNAASASGGWSTATGTGGIAVAGGATYIVSGWIQPTTVVGTGAYLRPLEYSAAGALVNDWGATAMTPITGSGGWLQVAFAITLQSNTAFLALHCQLNGTGTVWFDSLTIQKAFDSQTGLYATPFADQVALSGSAAGVTTSFTLPYPGTAWTEPTYQLNVPNTNTAVITQLVLTNTQRSPAQALTINFPNGGLAASTAYTLTIDTVNFTVTDQNGTKYDFTGSFPFLYPSATAFTAKLTTASGTTTGVTLDTSWRTRWSL